MHCGVARFVDRFFNVNNVIAETMLIKNGCGNVKKRLLVVAFLCIVLALSQFVTAAAASLPNVVILATDGT